MLRAGAQVLTQEGRRASVWHEPDRHLRHRQPHVVGCDAEALAPRPHALPAPHDQAVADRDDGHVGAAQQLVQGVLNAQVVLRAGDRSCAE